MAEEIAKFIDANVFLEVFLLDENWEGAAEFLKKVSEAEITCFTSDFIVYSILLQIQNRTGNKESMKAFITFLDNMKGLKIARSNPEILMTAINYMETNKLDFDDSVQLSFMNSLGLTEIVSFDKDFDNINWIKRVEP